MSATLDKIKSHRTVRQFIKFSIVGASSTVVDWGLHALLYKGFAGTVPAWLNPVIERVLPGIAAHPDFDGAFTVLKAVSFIVATLNGFYWNRRWTFKIRGKEGGGRHLLRFYLVNIIGLGINTLVASQIHKPHGGVANYIIALGTATFVTMFWNFIGHKFWTFRANEPSQPNS
jgi:putative flippase GtrA